MVVRFLYYSFGRVHKTLRVTPAMKAGLADHAWSFEEIAARAPQEPWEYVAMGTPKPLIDKYESRRIRVQIRHVLLEVWDPIGVKDEPHAQDEYDGYIGEIYELLVSKASDSKIAEYLLWVVNDRMGLGAARVSDMDPTVQALRAIPLISN